MNEKQIIRELLGSNEWKVVNRVEGLMGQNIKYSCLHCFHREVDERDYTGPESIPHVPQCIVLEARKILDNEKDE